MHLLLAFVLPAAAADCPSFSAEAVRVTKVEARCLGDASHLYAVRRDGDAMWIKALTASLPAADKARGAVQGAELAATKLSAGKVYYVWDPPQNGSASVKLLEAGGKAFDTLR